MLYFVLAISLVHLAWMNLLTFLKVDIALRIVSACALLGVLVCAPSVPLLLQAITLVLLGTACHYFAPKRPSVFATASLVVVFAIFGFTAWQAKLDQNDLVERFPMESMADRVPVPKFGRPHRQPAENDQWNFFASKLEDEIEAESSRFWSRSSMLRKIHEDATENFINSPGFGITRMTPPRLTRERLDHDIDAVKPIEQSPTGGPTVLSTEDLERPFTGHPTDSLRKLHFGGLADFVIVKGFGYAKDREHVAGFRPHQFSKRPDADMAVRLERLELVSLLMHDHPVVYISKELPRMSELKKAATRGLSDFESVGLGKLEIGEDLFVRETPGGTLMLGAIRAVNQCTKCHGGERGDLLGAFSYTVKLAP